MPFLGACLPPLMIKGITTLHLDSLLNLPLKGATNSTQQRKKKITLDSGKINRIGTTKYNSTSSRGSIDSFSSNKSGLKN